MTEEPIGEPIGADPVRVMLVDDHPLYLDGLRALIARADDLEVAGEATTAAKAVDLALELQPDVVVMDLQLPGGSGIDATRLITDRSPAVSVLVLTMFDDDDSVFAAMRAGATGYLLKGADRSDIIRAIRAVAGGEAVFGPGIARRLVGFFADLGETGKLAPLPVLTAREREVLDLIATGMKNAEIADRLHLSGKTVRNNISNIFSKLHVTDRAAAIVRARDAGLGRS